MRVLFCSLKNSYARPEWGLSHEYLNLYDSLAHMEGVEASFFAIDERLQAVGRDVMNEELLRSVQEQKPDVLFCQLFTEEVKKETIAYITTHTATKTINWFGDDHWRFHIYSKAWAPLFSLVATTDAAALPLYQRKGVRAVLTQWAVNPHRYHHVSAPIIDVSDKVTFVGQKYGVRSQYHEALSNAGLPAQFFGAGWSGGSIQFETMLSIFSQSAISLNFTESPHGQFAERIKLLGKLFFKKEQGRVRLNLRQLPQSVRALPGYQRRQIKGRIFEVLGCGGFLISGNAECLEDYYELGTELVVFNSAGELAELCQYYMNSPEERTKIAQAGYQRTLRDHTYEQRFGALFKAL